MLISFYLPYFIFDFSYFRYSIFTLLVLSPTNGYEEPILNLCLKKQFLRFSIRTFFNISIWLRQ